MAQKMFKNVRTKTLYAANASADNAANIDFQDNAHVIGWSWSGRVGGFTVALDYAHAQLSKSPAFITNNDDRLVVDTVSAQNSSTQTDGGANLAVNKEMMLPEKCAIRIDQDEKLYLNVSASTSDNLTIWCTVYYVDDK